MGVHEWDISIAEASSLNLLVVSINSEICPYAASNNALKSQPSLLISVLTPPTMLFLKDTFFIMYLQIFRPLRWVRICAYIGALFTTLFYISMTVAVSIFSIPGPGETLFSHQATPREHLSLAMSVPQSAVGLAIDLYILVLPIVAVTQLQLSAKRKFGVILLFMTGLL